MGADVHGPRWGIGHASGSAMLLVPDRNCFIKINLKNRDRDTETLNLHTRSTLIRKEESRSSTSKVYQFGTLRNGAELLKKAMTHTVQDTHTLLLN